MHWTNDRHNGAYLTVLAIEKEELPILCNAMKSYVQKLQTAYDKLEDIHQIGEATEKQETKRSLISEELNTLNNFINQSLSPFRG